MKKTWASGKQAKMAAYSNSFCSFLPLMWLAFVNFLWAWAWARFGRIRSLFALQADLGGA
jgi:hypothetical protein